MSFDYDKDTTREVCRNCGSRYYDFYYADKSGMCDDCLVDTGHLGLTNLPRNPSKEAKENAKRTIEILSRRT